MPPVLLGFCYRRIRGDCRWALRATRARGCVVTPRSTVDPELHILRTLSRSLEGRDRSELESARWNVFAAFEARDQDKARRWTAALRTALLGYAEGEMREQGMAALDTIEEAIDG